MVNLMELRRKIILNTPHIETSSGNPLSLLTDMALAIKSGKIFFTNTSNGYFRISLTMNGTTIDIPFPKTIYDGYVDLINNEVVETHNLATPVHYPLSNGLVHLTLGQNMSTIVNGRSSTGGYANSTATGADGCKFIYFELGWPTEDLLQYSADASQVSEFLSDSRVLVNGTTTNARLGEMVMSTGSSTDYEGDRLVYLYISVPSSYTDLTAKRSYLANNPISIVYPRKHPISYSIDVDNLKLIKGTNSISSSANGNVEVKYWSH